ncbi:thioredoxin family protein [Microbacterium sp. NPDC078428]|uniref:thioredoxin family protein n=1 Tax=Microbacterium sp. NPDC078428 TaxID=3364190 RepID=UPI0037C5CABA
MPALTGADFDDKVSSEPLALVDFWADWCSPCHAMKPALAELARSRPDGVAVYAVDVVAEPGLAERFGVISLPTVMLFRSGAPVARSAGVKREAHLRRFVAQHAEDAAL